MQTNALSVSTSMPVHVHVHMLQMIDLIDSKRMEILNDVHIYIFMNLGPQPNMNIWQYVFAGYRLFIVARSSTGESLRGANR